ncbi:MAG: methionyl-tRNA formyltransferase [Gammaproteobacteria bacterium]|nr:methionyl-tRNA formyltransferase [Gammaproteobacteria bacterium]
MKSTGLNIVFAGTPEFGLPALDALLTSQHHVLAVYTQPDRPSGRGQVLQPSPIKLKAQAHHLPVYQPLNFRDPAVVAQLSELAPDLMVVIAYGLILPQSVLSIPRLGCINVHASLLPAWRGASPIQSAILNADDETGVTIMQLDVGMDTGPMLATAVTPIETTDTAGSLHDKLSQLGVAPLLSVLDRLATGEVVATPQPQDNVSYAKKIQKEDACIDWTQSAEHIDRLIRAYQPWPVAYTSVGELRIRVFAAEIDNTLRHPERSEGSPGEIIALNKQGILVAAGHGAIRIKQLQFPGGKVLHVADWLHARSGALTVGQCLGS